MGGRLLVPPECIQWRRIAPRSMSLSEGKDCQPRCCRLRNLLRRAPDEVTRAPRRVGRSWAAGALIVAIATSSVGIESASSARSSAAPRTSTCNAKPWTKANYQAGSSPVALAALVLTCLEKLHPTTYRHDELGIVALNAYPWFQNVNEFGLTSTVQHDLARLGMPPITLQDGPGGIITRTSPSPTAMTNELALGATFDTSMASLYGAALGAQAGAMGYDGLQAPNLNLTRVPSWGRASESFGESPVLAGEMGAAEAVAIEGQHLIPVLKHFGPYSQETNRKFLNQQITQRARRQSLTDGRALRHYSAFSRIFWIACARSST